MVKLRDAIGNTKNKAIQNNKYTRAYLKTQKSCIIQTKAKWKQRIQKQETMKRAYHNEQQLCEKL